jgi:hypothetical protein
LQEGELKFIKNWAEMGYDLTKADEAMQGTGIASPEKFPKHIINKLAANERLQVALVKEGITFKKLAEKLNELLECEDPKYVGRPDNTVRHRAFQDAVRLLNADPPQKVNISKDEHREIHVTVDHVQKIEKALNARVVEGELLPNE